MISQLSNPLPVKALGATYTILLSFRDSHLHFHGFVAIVVSPILR